MSDSADGAAEPKERPLDCSVGGVKGVSGGVKGVSGGVKGISGGVKGVSDGVKGEHVNTVARLSTE